MRLITFYSVSNLLWISLVITHVERCQTWTIESSDSKFGKTPVELTNSDVKEDGNLPDDLRIESMRNIGRLLHKRERRRGFRFPVNLRNIGKRFGFDGSSNEHVPPTNTMFMMRNIGKRILNENSEVPLSKRESFWRNIGKRSDNDFVSFDNQMEQMHQADKRARGRFWNLVRRNPMNFRNIGKRFIPMRNIGKRMHLRNIGKRLLGNIGKRIQLTGDLHRDEFEKRSFIRNIGKRFQSGTEMNNSFRNEGRRFQLASPAQDTDHITESAEDSYENLMKDSPRDSRAYSKKGAIMCPPNMSRLNCYNNVIAYYIKAMRLMS